MDELLSSEHKSHYLFLDDMLKFEVCPPLLYSTEVSS